MQIIAHRGASGDFPELTLTAFEQGFVQGADALECDIRLTSCGTVVCVHDKTIERVSNGTGQVERMTFEELSKHNFGTEEAPSKPCTLDELLELMKAHPEKELYIETKHPTRYGRMIEEQLVMRLRYFGLVDDPRMHVISFSPLAMRRMKQLAPHIDRIFLREDKQHFYSKPIESWGDPTAYGLSIEHARAFPEKVGAYGKPTYLWTVDLPEDMLWARDHGIDMLATNYPALARSVLG